jgi:hypothetical protein
LPKFDDETDDGESVLSVLSHPVRNVSRPIVPTSAAAIPLTDRPVNARAADKRALHARRRCRCEVRLEDTLAAEARVNAPVS